MTLILTLSIRWKPIWNNHFQFPPMSKPTKSILTFILIITSCMIIGRLNVRRDNCLRARFLEQVIVCANSGKIFDLTANTDFDWDRFYFLNSDSGIREEQFSAIVEGEPMRINDWTCRFCFLA